MKPEFAEKIFEGTKKYEFRRALYDHRRKTVEGVVVYASAPISKTIGEFEIEAVLCEKLQTLWRETRAHAADGAIRLLMSIARGR